MICKEDEDGDGEGTWSCGGDRLAAIYKQAQLVYITTMPLLPFKNYF